MPYSPPVPISHGAHLDTFDCGTEAPNVWLQQTALKGESKTARTYVVCQGDSVVGYYCLSSGHISRARLPTAKLRKDTPTDIPVIVIGRLAVDRDHQRTGLGGALLKDGLQRAIAASQSVGIRAVLVHAIDDEAAAYYRERGFVPTRDEPRTLILPIETAIAALG